MHDLNFATATKADLWNALKAKPDEARSTCQGNCCARAKQYLRGNADGWAFRPKGSAYYLQGTTVNFCPWCGLKLGASP